MSGTATSASLPRRDLTGYALVAGCFVRFLTPVVAPLFAWLLLSQGAALATAAGGALIVAVFGRDEAELEPL